MFKCHLYPVGIEDGVPAVHVKDVEFKFQLIYPGDTVVTQVGFEKCNGVVCFFPGQHVAGENGLDHESVHRHVSDLDGGIRIAVVLNVDVDIRTPEAFFAVDIFDYNFKAVLVKRQISAVVEFLGR